MSGPDTTEPWSAHPVRNALACRFGPRLRSASYITGPLGGVGTTWLLAYDSYTGLWPFGAGIVLGFVTAIVQLLARWLSAVNDRFERAMEEAAAAAAMRPVNTLANLLDPILRTAAEAATEKQPHREETFHRLSQQLVDSIVTAYRDRRNLRSVLYELTHNGADRAAGLRVIAQQTNGDRESAQDFTTGDARGRAALQFVQEGPHPRILYVEDTQNTDAGWARHGGRYRTFVSVAVCGVTTPYGMITLDSPEVDHITQDDTYQLRLAAGVAAILFAERQRKPRW